MEYKMLEALKAEPVEGGLKCTITPTTNNGDLQFAFYLDSFGERLETLMYQSESEIVIPAKRGSGYYQVTGFVRDGAGRIEWTKTAPLFCPLNDCADLNSLQEKSALILKGKHWDFRSLFFPGNPGDPLFVMMPSAVIRPKAVLPFFNRWTWANERRFPGHVLCIADPTLQLDESMWIGWCIGDAERDATTDLAGVIYSVAANLNVPAERTIFYGSSAGGFSALAAASNLPGSTAVAINTQTDVLKYETQRDVNMLVKASFKGRTVDEIRRHFRRRIDMSANWSAKSRSRAFLVQNVTDKHHYEVHFAPFWEHLGGKTRHGFTHAGKHTAWIYHQEGGHVSETKEMASEIARRVLTPLAVRKVPSIPARAWSFVREAFGRWD